MVRAFIAIVLLATNGGVLAGDFIYSSVVTLCTGTCASFDALALGSTVTGTVAIDVVSNETFDFADVDASSYEFLIFNPAVPEVPYDGSNVTNANPLPVIPDNAVLRESGGGLVTGGDANSGLLLFELVGILPGSDAWLIFDLASGDARICLFFTTAGCIPGATLAVMTEGQFTNLTDTDGDFWFDIEDNCVETSGSQRDTDVDGFGNICDPDFNNDCSIDFVDLGIIKQRFFSNDEDADLNGDGFVDFIDLGVVKAMFFGMPGPSFMPSVCAPHPIVTETFGDGGTPTDGGWNAGTGNVVADAGDDGPGDPALMYTATPPQAGFHVLHPDAGGTPNVHFLGNFRFNYATDVVFRARHSGVGDPVVLRVVLFDLNDAVDWAQTAAAVTISNTATTWQTYTLSIRQADLVTGGADGLSLNTILQSVEQISLRHDPLGTGPLTHSPVTQETTVFFDDISLSAQGGGFPAGPF